MAAWNRLFWTRGLNGNAPPRILVVDDDPTVRKIFQRRLSRNGYRVETAENGFKTGIVVSQQKPDLVLLDLTMPGLGGLEALEAIKLILGNSVQIIVGEAFPRKDRKGNIKERYCRKMQELNNLMRSYKYARIQEFPLINPGIHLLNDGTHLNAAGISRYSRAIRQAVLPWV